MTAGAIENGKMNKKPKNEFVSYSDAIDLAGNGCYTVALMVILSISLLSMCIDLFSFSVVVAFGSCDLDLTLGQKSFLVSIPFMGPVLMSYAWGYISDTRGRRLSLLIALSVSFLMSTLSAFSPNWIVLAVLKLIGTCFVSCVQSAVYTLFGESCPERVKGFYLLIMSSTMHLACSVNFSLGYFIGNLNFLYDLGFITFVPWRLLTLVLALPVGVCAFALYFLYESPKFLLNMDRHDEALDILKRIHRINGGNVKDFKVEKVELDEVGNVDRHDVSLFQSMREQTLPLLKPPLLWNTLLLYYIVSILYSVNSGLFIWLPFIAKAFSADTLSANATYEGFCHLIVSSSNENIPESACAPSLDITIVLATIICGISTTSLNLILSKFASRKKLLMILTITSNLVSSLITLLMTNSYASFFYFGILTNSICMGLISTYYVDLYPTSFRGMAGCLGVMMARFSSIVGINVIGPFLVNNCTETFYSIAACLFSAVLISFLLPPDRPKKI